MTEALSSWVKWAPGWAEAADRLAAAWERERVRPWVRWRGPLAAALAATRRLARPPGSGSLLGTRPP